MTQIPVSYTHLDVYKRQDWTCPDDLADEHPLIGDEVVDFTYGELQEEMNLINRAFIEVMTCLLYTSRCV